MTRTVPYRSSILALAAIVSLALTPPADAQGPGVPPVDQPGLYPHWTGTRFTAPSDLHWDERLPRRDPEPTAADMEGARPRTRMADPADLEGIFRYRFIGEHRVAGTGYSVSVSNDLDCDGFAEVVIGAVTAGGESEAEPGAVYVVSMADVEAADAADGAADRVIDLGLVAAQPRSWKLTSEGLHYVGTSVATGGDVNGDGCSELLVGARAWPGYFAGSAYVVSAADLPAADAADGARDGVVDIRRIADQPDSWVLTGEADLDNAGRTVIFAGDVNRDGLSDLLIGALFYGDDNRGAAYLLSGAALASADAADGAADGSIALASVASQPDSWKLVGELDQGLAGSRMAVANLDSDGRPDLVVAAYVQFYDDAVDERGAVYLIAAADLPVMDGADGRSDGVIDLGNVADGPASWKLVGDIEDQHIGAYGVAAGDVDGDGVDNVVISNYETGSAGRSGEVFVISVSGLPSADTADGARDGVVTLDRALEQEGSFMLTREGALILDVSSGTDIDRDGLDDLLVGEPDFVGGSSCLPGGGARGEGSVYVISGASLRDADASDGVEDSVVDLDRVSLQEGSWQVIGGPTDRLGSTVATGDLDGDGNDDLMLAAWYDHTPYLECGSAIGPGFAFVMSGLHLTAADAVDGATDGTIRLDALRAELGPLVVREVAQFEDSVVVMRISRPLRTTELDFDTFDTLAESFYSHYRDEFDWLIFISNLPTLRHDQHHDYRGVYRVESNSVKGIGRDASDSRKKKLKGILHFPYRDAILDGPSLHEIMHAWGNYAIPTAAPLHWGFSSANGQLGGFDRANLVDLGRGRYSAGSFGDGGSASNWLPYSPIELYFAGLIPPEEVPDLWVARDGKWLYEEDESGNPIFAASDVETWSIRRIVEEHGTRVPDWRTSQKSFRTAVVLVADDGFRAEPAVLRKLSEDLRTFTHPGPDDRSSYNFWEATGGRATLTAGDLRINRPPIGVGALPDRRLALNNILDLDVSPAFVEPDGEPLTYAASSSAPGVVTAVAIGAQVTVTAVAIGEAAVTVTATDPGGLAATQSFRVAVMTTVPFTDDPIVAGMTPVRAVHFTELRTRVDVLRRAAGLALFPWTDGILTPGVTGVRLVHLTELREAVTAAYAAAGRPRPAWTDAGVRAGTTPIRAAHVTELRAAVVGLENGAPTGLMPDLVVGSPTVSDSTLTAGQSFTLSATVRNRGSARAAATTLRWYRSTDSTISGSDMAVGADAVSALTAGASVAGSIGLTAPGSAGTYYYGACVEPVGGESDTGNNCSSGVRVTVEGVEGANRPPRPTGSIPAQTLTAGGSAVRIDSVGQYFTDPDGDALTYTARSSRPGVVTASVSSGSLLPTDIGPSVSLTPVAAGTATVTVTATDPGALTATQRISVTVQGGGGSSACAVGEVYSPGESCTHGGATFSNVGGGCFTLSTFGTGRLCSRSFNGNGWRITRVGSADFRIDALP